jgi:phage-related holin
MKTKFLALPLAATLVATFQKYIFGDFEYVKWLLIVVLLDLITGITKAWIQEKTHKAITSKGLRMTVVKFVQYGAFLVVTHVLANFQVNGAGLPAFSFIDSWAFFLLMLIEIKSVYENIVAIDPRWDFINKILAKINSFIKSDPK